MGGREVQEAQEGLGEEREEGAREILGREEQERTPTPTQAPATPPCSSSFNLPSASLSEVQRMGPYISVLLLPPTTAFLTLFLVIYQDQGEISPGL